MAAHTCRVAICGLSGDSAAAMTDFLQRDPGIEVVDVLDAPEELLSRDVDAGPDLLALDLESTAGGGTRAIERIMRERPVPILLLEGNVAGGPERAAAALAAGALEALPKARVRMESPDDVWAIALRSRVKRLASVRLGSPDAGRAAVATVRWRGVDRPFQLVGVGASSGGPPALTTVLGELPDDYALPVLVVQHIAPSFGEGLVTWLDQRVGPPVRIAQAGGPVSPGVWFAPDDTHLSVDSELRFAFDDSDRGPHRPSADVLFESMVAAVGPEALGVVLTGMGRDGAVGVEAMCAAGATVIAQDEESSAVFGMPRAAIESGAEHVLPLAEIGPALRSLRVPEAV
jgi:chemotaxis response regulator CheB